MTRNDWIVLLAFLTALVIGVAGYGGVSADVTLDRPITQHSVSTSDKVTP